MKQNLLLYPCFIYLLFILISIIYPHSSSAQSWEWIKTGGGKGLDEGIIIKNDSIGNLYIAGTFEEEATFQGTKIVSKGGKDVFFMKCNSNGQLLWIKTTGTYGNDHLGKLAVDAMGNSYLVVYLYDLSTQQNNPVSIVKYNSGGEIILTHQVAFSYSLSVDDLFFDIHENAYFLLNDANGSPKTFDNIELGRGQVLVKINKLGKYEKHILPSDIYRGGGEFSTVDSKGNIYLLSGDHFLIKINPSGEIIYKKQILQNTGIFHSQMVTDQSDNLIFTYVFYGQSQVGDSIINSSGYHDIGIIKLNQDGDITWFKKIGGSDMDYFQNISMDNQNNFYICLSVRTPVTIDNFEISPEKDGIFHIVKFDADMKAGFVKSSRFIHFISNSFPQLIGLTAHNGNAYISGNFVTNDIYDNDTLKSQGFTDAFFGKLSCVPYLDHSISGDTLVCNGSHNYNINSIPGISYKWSVTEGAATITENKNSAEINWKKEGIYTVTVTPTNKCGAGSPRQLRVRVKEKPVKPELSGDTLTCTGTTAYSVPYSKETNFTWQLSGGGGLVTIENTAVANLTTTGKYILSVKASNMCGTSDVSANFITVDKIPEQPSSIIGKTESCLSNENYSVNPSANIRYNWTLGSGGSVTFDNAVASVKWNTAGSHPVTVTPFNHCGIGQSRSLNVTVKDVPAQPSAINGNSPVCKGTQSYNIIEIPEVNYRWSITGGGALTSANGTANVIWAGSGNFQIAVTPSNVCGAGQPRIKAIEVTDVPQQSEPISGLEDVCLGSQLYIVPAVTKVNYAWTISSGGTLTSAGNSAQVKWTNPGIHSLSLTPYNICGYGPPVSLAVTVKNTSSRIDKINGKGKACLSDEIYNVPLFSDLNYNWSLNAGGIIQSSGNSANVSWKEKGLFTVTVSTNDGCSISLPVTVKDIPSRPDSISGPLSTCIVNTSYSLTQEDETIYQWSLNGGGNLQSFSNTAVVNWNKSGSFTLSVSPSNYCGTGPAQTAEIIVKDRPSSPDAISGDSIVCPGSIEYQTNYITGNKYLWNTNEGNLLSANANTASITWKQKGEFSISVKAENECGVSPSVSKSVQVISIPDQVVISGDTSSCHETRKYSALNLSPGNNYRWNVSAGGSTISQDEKSTVVNWNTSGLQSVSVTASNKCGTGMAATLNVMVKDVPPQIRSFTGATSACPGVKYYSAVADNATDYKWKLSEGGNLGSVNGNSTTVNWMSAGIHTLSVAAVNSCGTGNDTSVVITVLFPPASAPVISGPQQNCIGEAIYSSPQQPGYWYNWNLNGPGELLADIESSAKVNWNEKGNATLIITPYNVCGNGPSGFLKVSVADVPAIPEEISGPSVLCKGSEYSFSTASAGLTYDWKFTGKTSLSTISGNTFKINPSDTGIYTVTVVTSNQCGKSIAREKGIKIITRPQLTVTEIEGPANTCTGNSDLYRINNTDAANLFWAITPADSRIVSAGQITRIDWMKKGVYSVKTSISNECGTSDALLKSVTVEESPVKAEILRKGDTLFSDYAGTNRWYRDGKLLAADSLYYITELRPGRYQTQAVNQCGTAPKSEEFIIGAEEYYGFPVIPNPAVNEVTVKIPLFLQWKKVEILTELGTKISEKENSEDLNSVSFDISEVNAGMYFMLIHTELGVYIEKFVKVK